jgi:DNA-binding XRE family transcriptional regulator
MTRKNPYVGESIAQYTRARAVRSPAFAAEIEQQRLARRIRQLRESKKLTQAELADRVGTTQSSIARIESGRSAPTLELLRKVADALGHQLTVEFTQKRRRTA